MPEKWWELPKWELVQFDSHTPLQPGVRVTISCNRGRPLWVCAVLLPRRVDHSVQHNAKAIGASFAIEKLYVGVEQAELLHPAHDDEGPLVIHTLKRKLHMHPDQSISVYVLNKGTAPAVFHCSVVVVPARLLGDNHA